MFNIRKKLIQVWNDTRVSKWWQKFYFWVNYPFKGIKLSLHEKKKNSFVPNFNFQYRLTEHDFKGASKFAQVAENLAMSLSVTHFIFYFYSKKYYFGINSGLRIPGIR